MNDCNIKLSPKQIKHLKRIYTTESGRTARRAHIVLLKSKGYTQEKIAELCLCDRDTVSDALHRFKTKNYEGLYDKPQTGRECILNEEDVQWLLNALRQNPHEFGYYATVWSVPMMVQLLRDQRNKTVSSSTIRDVLKRHNWEFNRPKQIPPAVCPLREQEKNEIIRLMLHPEPNEVLLFGDESDFEWLPYITGAWMPKGEQLEIPTPGHNQVLCCFGFFCPNTQEFFYKLVRTRHNKTAKNFIGMLHQLRSRYTGKIIHIVIDNASIHDPHTRLLKQFRLTYGDQFVVHFLPKHSPILNPIERFWRFLKQRICGNWLYETLDSLIDSFRSFIWHYRQKDVVYNFSSSKLISIWKKHPTIEQMAQAI